MERTREEDVEQSSINMRAKQFVRHIPTLREPLDVLI